VEVAGGILQHLNWSFAEEKDTTWFRASRKREAAAITGKGKKEDGSA
jgi:hypothetical protein